MNDFDRVGVCTAFLFRELLAAGLMHDDVETVMGHAAWDITRALSGMKDENPVRSPTSRQARYRAISPYYARQASRSAGRRPAVLAGNLGEAVVKVSAVALEHRVITAPAHVFDTQADVIAAFGKPLRTRRSGRRSLSGAAASGMPELHQLTPALSVLLDRGIKVKTGDRRPHVRRLGSGACGDSRHARSRRWCAQVHGMATS